MRISVIICTRNRAALLAQALESVARQDYSPDDFEIIVVDNGSTDDTKSVTDSYCPRSSNLHYVKEEKVGLSHARNLGWKEARGSYLVYLDDDVVLPDGYLKIAREVIDAVHPAVFGGPIYPFYASPKPAWFKDEYTRAEVTDQARELNETEFLNGGNFVIRPEVLELCGGFSVNLGMRGDVLAYGEETALIRWVRARRPEMLIYYEPRLLLYHLVRPEKLKLSYWVRDRFARGRYNYLTFSDGEDTIQIRHLLGFFTLPLIILINGTIGVLLRDRKKFPYYQNFYFERVLKQVVLFGKLTERLLKVSRVSRKES